MGASPKSYLCVIVVAREATLVVVHAFVVVVVAIVVVVAVDASVTAPLCLAGALV